MKGRERQMVRRKSRATFMVADGTGGMAQVQDRRFDGGDWPIRFDVPKEQVDTWLQYLSAECERRGWSCSLFKQLDAKENSGSVTVSIPGGQPRLIVLWERKREGPIKVRARAVQTPEFALEQAEDFFREVNQRSALGTTETFHRGWHLCYTGLPWRGELWLDDRVRLGPPSQQDEMALIGPRIILINALVNGIDLWHAGSVFEVALRELSVFLSVVWARRSWSRPMAVAAGHG
jgi:hypothetical protein